MREQIQEKLNMTKHKVGDMAQGVPEDAGQRLVYLLQVINMPCVLR